MTLDRSLQEYLQQTKSAREEQRTTKGGGGSGGGDEPPGGETLDLRVRALEATVSSIDKTLAVMAEQLKHVALREDLGALRAELATKASATDLAELKGRVARIPTVPVLVSILVFISLLFAAGSWVVRHLPEGWSRALQ